MIQTLFDAGSPVPADVLRVIPDDGFWDIRFGQMVLVTRSPSGARVEVPDFAWPTTAPLCIITRPEWAPKSGPTVFQGGPTEWHNPVPDGPPWEAP